jgi:hypothetical protein
MPDYFGGAMGDAFRKRGDGRRNDSAYPSDASIELTVGDEVQVHGTCLRKQYYRITETPQSDPEQPSDRFVANVGEAVHTEVAKTFFAAGQLIEEEMRIWIPEVRVSGRIDLIIRPEHGRRVGIEVKSVGGYYGVKGCIKATKTSPLYPRISHLCQTVVYAHHMADQFNEWQILYIDRETGAYRAHDIRYEDADTVWVNGEPSTVTPRRIYDRWHRLWQHVEGAEPPARDYEIKFSQEKIARLAETGGLLAEEKKRFKEGKKVDKGDIYCRSWCPWKTLCWSDA